MNDQSPIHPAAIRSEGDTSGYLLDVVSHPTGLERIKPEWDALVARDPASGLFMSHDWLMPGLLAHPNRWRVFVLRAENGAPICILPIKHRLHWSGSRNQFQTEIEAAGRLAWGEYTGFVCDPERETEGLVKMAQAIRQLRWKKLSLRYVPTETRLRVFAEALGPGFSHRFRDYIINKGTTNNLISPQVPLPADFDAYLADRVSSNTRQKIRRHRRKLLENGTYRIEVSTAQTLERDIAMLLTNWLAKWDGERSASSLQTLTESYGRALLTAAEMDALYLVSLWQGDRMLGALGHIVDREGASSHFLVAGRDPNATDPAIGLLLHAHAIEWAIAQGLKTYDFGHGDEPYKFSFGPEKVPTHFITIRREGGDQVLDPVNLKQALVRLAEFAQAGQTDRVEAGSTQLAELLPQ